MPGLVIAVLACVAIHLLAIAAAGWGVGVTIREFSLGFGPAVFRSGIFRLGAIPLGGYVRFRDSSTEAVPAHEMETAFDGRSTAEQVFIAAAGCAVLLLVAVATPGADGLQAFVSGFRQAIAGAVSPLGEAQVLLRDATSFVRGASFTVLLGVAAAKLAAINLLPLPVFNGGVVIAVLARRHLAGDKWWPPGATTFFLWVWLAFVVSWGCAVIVHVVGR
jgi:membrane-associated protease RseP (regulator of RpoE activity)